MIRQLRKLVTVVALFFLLGFFGIFISSHNSVQSLSVVNSINDIYSINTQALQLLAASAEDLEKAFVPSNWNDISFIYSTNKQQAVDRIQEAISKSQQYPKVLIELEEALKSMDRFDIAVQAYLDKLKPPLHKLTPEQLRAELLVTTAYRNDVEESLRKARIELKKSSDESFSVAYSKRYFPVLVAIVMTLLSLTYVSVVGVSITKNFEESIKNLSTVTDVVAHGNLDIQAKILKHDEIGSLSNSFNQMVLALKENRDQLNQAIQVRDDFISIASHELRTPLTPLRMQTYILKKTIRDMGTDIPKIRELESIVLSCDRQLDRIIQLAENLLDVSRITRGNLTLNREKCDLGILVREVVGRYQNEIDKAGCKLTLNLQEGVIGEWDVLRIEQVVVNLLSNSIKYGPGKPLEIRVEKGKRGARFSLRDHGIGISKEDQSKIFERFARAVPITSYGGLGLGLFITKQIVQAHGGIIQVESNAGEGAEFIVELPYQAVAAEPVKTKMNEDRLTLQGYA